MPTGVSFLRDRTRHAEATEKISSFLRTFLTHGYQEKFGLNWVSREPSVADRLTRRLPLTGGETHTPAYLRSLLFASQTRQTRALSLSLGERFFFSFSNKKDSSSSFF